MSYPETGATFRRHTLTRGDADDPANGADNASGPVAAGAHAQLPVPRHRGGGGLGTVYDRRTGCSAPQIVGGRSASVDRSRRDIAHPSYRVSSAGLAAAKRGKAC